MNKEKYQNIRLEKTWLNELNLEFQKKYMYELKKFLQDELNKMNEEKIEKKGKKFKIE